MSLVWPAEFKAKREAMGLSSAWLAKRWGVSLMSVQRWERNKEMPKAVQLDFLNLMDDFADEVEQGIAEDAPIISVPRIDAASPDEFPSAYHRAIAERVTEQKRARIVFTEE